MAGIYARGETDDDPVTFAILTTKANDLMAPIHERIAREWELNRLADRLAGLAQASSPPQR